MECPLTFETKNSKPTDDSKPLHFGCNFKTITIKRDGDAWFAHRSDFINLQESIIGYGDTSQTALAKLLSNEV